MHVQQWLCCSCERDAVCTMAPVLEWSCCQQAPCLAGLARAGPTAAPLHTPAFGRSVMNDNAVLLPADLSMGQDDRCMMHDRYGNPHLLQCAGTLVEVQRAGML